MICRLCLYEGSQENSVALFCNGTESNLTKMIAKYMQIEISFNNIDFSPMICKQCYQHLIDFHNFCQYVEQRQNVLQNEFLEVNCVLTNTATAAATPKDAKTVEDNEESLLDMKDIVAVGEANLDKLLPQEFAFADDSDGINFENDDTIADADADIDRLDNDNDNEEDDLPLQTLFPNEYLSKGSKNAKKRKDEDPQQKLLKRTYKTRKIAPRKSIATTKRKKTTIKIVDPQNMNVGDTTESTIAVDTLKKRSCSSYTPEDNKFRNEIIAKHMRLKCEICNITEFKDFKDLRSHFRCEHNTRAYITCCGTRFYRRFVLVDHIQLHLNPEHFKCKVCNKVLKSKICLDIHHNNMHADKSQLRHACAHCDRRFARWSNLTAHMLSHTKEKNHLCEICNKGFKSNYMLKVHIRSMHGQRIPYICDICGKEYKFKPSFQRHVAEHKGQPNEPTEQCTICEKWLMPNGLRRHMDRHNMKDVECELCGKRLKSKAALIGHIEYNHKKTHNYACTFCDKTFKRPCVLKEHIAMHTGRKDYNCQYCEREFRSKANMYAHIKKTHVDQWLQAQIIRNKTPSGNNLKQKI